MAGPGAGIPGYPGAGGSRYPNLPGTKVNPASGQVVQPSLPGGPGGVGALPQRIVLPQHVSGSAFVDPPKVQNKQTGTKNRPRGTAGAAAGTPGTNPYSDVSGATAPAKTPQQIAQQISVLAKQLGIGGAHVPAAITLAHIAELAKGIPTSPNIPGKFSLASVAAAMTPSANTPGYQDPDAAAKAAVQQQYGNALATDQQNVDQTAVQNQQNLQDIQNWYNSMTSMAKSNAASDASGYDAAIQGTGNLGSVATALGMEPGSAGADTIGQTGSILNAAARMAAASGQQFDRNLISSMGLAGVQDYQNQKNKDASLLASLQSTLNQDQKSSGAAYTTARDAANQANTTNAQNYAQSLGQINQAYNTNFQNMRQAKQGLVSTLAGLNGQYNANNLNTIKTRIAALTSAAGIEALPAQLQGAAAKANYTNATAYKTYQDAQSNWLKAQTANIAAKAKAANMSQAQWLKSSQARFSLGGAVFKTAMADPKAFTHDPLTGATTLKSAKQAKTDIAAMLMQAGYDPSKGVGALLNQTAMALVLGQQ